MQGDMIRECLHNGTRVYGTHVTVLSNPVVASAFAAHLDFAFLCAEHMPLDRTDRPHLSSHHTRTNAPSGITQSI